MKFFRASLANLATVGTIAASSAKLSKLIVGRAELDSRKCVVELGSGTGPFTKQIIKKISPETLFFCLEINEQFVKETQRSCPSAVVYNASALEIKEYLQKHGRDTSDCIISGLPFGIFGKNIQEEILDVVYDSLDEGGSFLTIAYITNPAFPPGIRLKKLLHKKFSEVQKTEIIWGNFLPAFVYHCIK